MSYILDLQALSLSEKDGPCISVLSIATANM
jgi:hypothetical protein